MPLLRQVLSSKTLLLGIRFFLVYNSCTVVLFSLFKEALHAASNRPKPRYHIRYHPA